MVERTTLERIKATLASLQTQNGKGIPRSDLVLLANGDARIVIDGEAVETLGHPLVVVEPVGDPPDFAALTPRQAEVARLVARGLRNREIADELFISVATVKDHVHAILSKLQLTSRSEVAGLHVRHHRMT